MPNDSNKTLTAVINDIGNYVHNLEIDDLKKEELLKTPHRQIFEGAFCRPCVLFCSRKGS